MSANTSGNPFKLIGLFLCYALGGGGALHWAAKVFEHWFPPSWGGGFSAIPLWAWSILFGSGVLFAVLGALSDQIAALGRSLEDARHKDPGRSSAG